MIITRGVGKEERKKLIFWHNYNNYATSCYRIAYDIFSLKKR